VTDAYASIFFLLPKSSGYYWIDAYSDLQKLVLWSGVKNRNRWGRISELADKDIATEVPDNWDRIARLQGDSSLRVR